MKKIYKISILIICGFLLIGCPPDDEITTYETIKSVRARLFSFDKNGIYPYFEEFNPEQLRDAFLEIFEKEGIDGSFSIMGHSMGGRIVLAMSEFFEERIDSYIMLAPAGFQGAQSDSRLLFPKFVRRLLKGMTSRPAIILSAFKVGKFFGIINKGTYRFLEQQIAIPERRLRLFDCWISLYDFPIRLEAFRERIIKNKSKLQFFYGNKDFITPAKYGRKFISDIPGAGLHMVEDGHYFLKDPLCDALKKAKDLY